MELSNIYRVFERLGFFYVEKKRGCILVGHLRSNMIEAVTLNHHDEVTGGPYAELVEKALRALELYYKDADSFAYFSPEMRERFLEDISDDSGLPLEIVTQITKS